MHLRYQIAMGLSQQQGIQSHTAGDDIHTEDLNGEDLGGAALLSSDCELGLS